VKQIKNLTGGIRWRYCQTDSNPADLQTRELTAELLQYLANDLWYHGPEWITKEKLWPKWKAEPISVYTAQVEAVEEKLPPTPMSVECLFDISRVSTLLKLLRITTFVLRFIDRCIQSGDIHSVQSFSVEELCRAKSFRLPAASTSVSNKNKKV